MELLLGLGGTEESVRALEETVARAGAAGDDLTVALFESRGASMDRDELADAARSTAADAGLEVTLLRLGDDPGAELVTMAEREGFDRIVIGGGTASPMGKIQLGAVTEYVLLNARTTVTLVR